MLGNYDTFLYKEKGFHSQKTDIVGIQIHNTEEMPKKHVEIWMSKDSKLLAYNCRQSHEGTGWAGLQKYELKVEDCKSDNVSFVITPPFSGCAFIVCRNENTLYFYHDRNPKDNIEEKMANIQEKGKIVARVDHIEDYNPQYTTMTYGLKTKVGLKLQDIEVYGCQIICEFFQDGEYMFIQDTKIEKGEKDFIHNPLGNLRTVLI